MARINRPTFIDDVTGKAINPNAVCTIVLTAGEHTWTVDTARGGDLAKSIKDLGRQGSKRGRKVGQAATLTPSDDIEDNEDNSED